MVPSCLDSCQVLPARRLSSPPWVRVCAWPPATFGRPSLRPWTASSPSLIVPYASPMCAERALEALHVTLG
jgi:hypothetical protein